MSKALCVRQATLADVIAIHNIEQTCWGSEPGTKVLTTDDIAAMVSLKSPYTVVAEDAEGVFAYYHGVQTNFDFAAHKTFVSNLESKGYYADSEHNPKGTSMYGINVASVKRGGGSIVTQYITELMRNQNAEYYVAFSRIAGLQAYIHDTLGGLNGRDEAVVAAWYAARSARMFGAPVLEYNLDLPNIELPDPVVPDRVLCHHLRHTDVGVISLVPNYMPDDKSLNYGVFMVSKWPHVK